MGGLRHMDMVFVVGVGVIVGVIVVGDVEYHGRAGAGHN